VPLPNGAQRALFFPAACDVSALVVHGLYGAQEVFAVSAVFDVSGMFDM
jgi:hypothetical protein